MKTLHAQYLKALGVHIFTRQGLDRERAEFLVQTLVEANLTGHDSHGVTYYSAYSNRIKEGHIDVKADPKIVKETPASALVDGRWAPGQITAMHVMDLAVKKAKVNAVSAVGAYNCNHIGRVGYYTNWAAERDIIAMMFVNVGNPEATVFNGTTRVFGTNPISVAVPTGEASPFLVDYATSVVAEGKVSVVRAKGEKMPLHWARDKDDKPTDDPEAYRAGGWLMPFGEYKGYGLQFVSELLGAVLTGSRIGLEGGMKPPSPNGILAVALNPEAFVGLEAFKEKTDELITRVKAVKPQEGKRVQTPGEPEWETKFQRFEDGIPLLDETWGNIVSLANGLGIEVEE
jgi:LDH2 family malate/lactate/ureidoglycolate dehydrogenase